MAFNLVRVIPEGLKYTLLINLLFGAVGTFPLTIVFQFMKNIYIVNLEANIYIYSDVRMY